MPIHYKKEGEDAGLDFDPPLPKIEKIKICTLKVTHYGYKLGELFIKHAINFAVKSKIDAIYLTHFTEENDRLIPLIEEFGFEKYGIKSTTQNGKIVNEEVYFKRLIPNINCKTPIEIQNKFYPSFYDGEQVNKFIVPIWPKFHDKLFTGYPIRQVTLFEMSGGFIIEGNTIKKVYLSHSLLRKIKEGDMLIFYRSRDRQQLTSIGVIEKVIHNISDPNRIAIECGKRTVYSREDIEEFARKQTKIIFFNLNFHFPNPIKLKDLIEQRLLNNYPPSIRKIDHELYIKIKELSGIDSKYCIERLEI